MSNSAHPSDNEQIPVGKTRIVITTDDKRYSDYKEGETGYIDGYVMGGDNAPYVAVVLGERVTLVPFQTIKVIKP